jgi:predicted Holliday junction resolvase-like endonuclease
MPVSILTSRERSVMDYIEEARIGFSCDSGDI